MRKTYELQQRKTEKAYGGSLNRWIHATYQKNQKSLKGAGVSYKEFKRDIKGILEQEQNRFEKGDRISEPSAKEALKTFERSETYRSADERAYENMLEGLRGNPETWSRFKSAYRKTMGGNRSIPKFDEMTWDPSSQSYVFQREGKQVRVEVKIERDQYGQSHTYMYFYDESGNLIDKVETTNTSLR